MPDLGRSETSAIRPLRRVGFGHWRSRDERWTFLRHQSDPHPQRWYAFEENEEYPANDGLGHIRLQEVADWAEHEASLRGRSAT